MRVCVTALSAGLDAEVDPRFGRAQYFVFVDTENMHAESVANPNVNAHGGAGIQSAQLVAEKKAKVLITGHVGPNASQALSAAGIQVITGVSGITVREAVERFVSGKLEAVSDEKPLTGGVSKEDLKRELEEIKRRVAELEKKIEECKS